MAKVMLIPDMKTAGGEVCDIMLGGHFVGSLTLVYREGGRLSGSVQLDKESLPRDKKEKVIAHVSEYIQSFIGAVDAAECDVLVTYSKYDRIVTTQQGDLLAEDDDLDEEPYRYSDDEEQADDEETFLEWDGDTYEWDEGEWETAEYELIIVNEKRNRIEYQLYNVDGALLAEAFMNDRHGEITGELRWMLEPEEWEIEHATELLVTDYDENRVDTFVIDHLFDGQIIETVELTHEDLLDTPSEVVGEDSREYDYSVMLVRDDDDTLTYEIYQQSAGGLPIGTATVDIQYRRLTGFIDFRDPENAEDGEVIATLLMRELDKEKDYDGLNLTLMYGNEAIEEILFENETLH